MKWYKTGGYGNLIVEVEFISETDKFVNVLSQYNGKEERVIKLSNWGNYFKTYDEAKEFLKTQCEEKIGRLQRNLELLNEELIEINKLQFVHENVNTN